MVKGRGRFVRGSRFKFNGDKNLPIPKKKKKKRESRVDLLKSYSLTVLFGLTITQPMFYSIKIVFSFLMFYFIKINFRLDAKEP